MNRIVKPAGRLILYILFITGIANWIPAEEPQGTANDSILEYTFDTPGDLQGWHVPGCFRDVSVVDGKLKAVFAGNDPMIISPDFKVKTNREMYVEIVYRAETTGNGEFFFSDTHQGRYRGFSTDKRTLWPLVGDGNWHTVRFYPDWKRLDHIIKIRIDFGVPVSPHMKTSTLEIDSIRLGCTPIDGLTSLVPRWDRTQLKSQWQRIGREEGCIKLRSPRGKIAVQPKQDWLFVRLAPTVSPTSTSDHFSIFVSGYNVQQRTPFTRKIDLETKWNTFNIPMTRFMESGNVLTDLELTLPESIAHRMEEVSISPVPQGPGRLSIQATAPEKPFVRVGQTAPWFFRFRVIGKTVSKSSVTIKDLPPGVTVSNWTLNHHSVNPNELPDLSPLKAYTLSCVFTGTVPCDCEPELIFRNRDNEIGGSEFLRGFRIISSLKIEKCDYVPPPKPVTSPYEIGALYFPGWAGKSDWDRIADSCPIRKPILGWYDEGAPETVDWQIKWATENGIRFFLVDWYWNQGKQQLDHWVKAFYKARYRHCLKWAVMWANHNGHGSHSIEDQRAVTQFWIDHYFKTPEYYTIDGKPVVMIYRPLEMDDDIRALERTKGNSLALGQGVRILLNESQKLAQKAGFPGIYFVAMKWPEESTRSKDIQWLADAGFHCTSLYRFLGDGGKASDPMRYPFSYIADATLPYLENRIKTGILPFLPNLSTGWDSRPWHGDKKRIVSHRTSDLFRQICSETKSFCDRNNIKRIVIGPLNEWGEGSYIEPNAEFGFQMYNTIRETFCDKPKEGFPPNIVPEDIGRTIDEHTK